MTGLEYSLGGCACAGTYGHFLLHVSHDQSKQITERINFGDLSKTGMDQAITPSYHDQRGTLFYP